MQEKLLELVILLTKIFGRKHKTLESLKRKEQFLDSFKRTDKSDIEGQIKIELIFQHIYDIFLNRDVISVIINSPNGGEILHYLEKGASKLKLDDNNNLVYCFKFDRQMEWVQFWLGLCMLFVLFPYSLYIANKLASLPFFLLTGAVFLAGLVMPLASVISMNGFRCADRVIKLYHDVKVESIGDK